MNNNQENAENNTRIGKLREYLIGIINTLTTEEFSVNADMLDNEPDSYSIDKVPMNTQVRKDVCGNITRREEYLFRSRRDYSQDTINNLENIGFFERFEYVINSNNRKGILPNIENISSIECISCGAMDYSESNTAEFGSRIQIEYEEAYEEDNSQE